MFIFNELRKKNKDKKLMLMTGIFSSFINGFLKNWSETRLLMSTIILEIKNKNNEDAWTSETDGGKAVNELQ